MPQPTAVIQIEGVLRKPVTGAVIESGRRLYHGLRSTYRIVLSTRETNRDHMTSWLGMEGFAGHDHIVYGDTWRPLDRTLWVSTAKMLKLSYGYDVDIIVLPDPDDAARLIMAGFNTLLFTQAAYALPEWRPDHTAGVKPWADLALEIAAEKALRAADKRTEKGLD